MKLADTLHTSRRGTASTSSMLGSITGRLGRSRTARMFPAEAERLVTPAEFKRLHG
ncbi:hypothetical protein Gbro_0125 [Gordonia bronchialis DSM 43247]|jgi:hypothetical protein|uniref:Uncharacterized protein n=1 Tax=Gordonia bronchialis (strain ATCC 25592 / DSM 43247 / BCRC 13721 / JCM 3198 / KCTC 3076 / NBRC 16047 / NCTC 10667) TaxID=526226 RepID=D0LB43_GORB4|nr:hypothetical protein [Gordonia bronchialis]ACY19474.1 hypothetical protein Gbro_0125 [Gordonia bronchialis DSM 43247]MCC3322254.1 hypothetical protein [Gordonia bronchialis]UAK37032.1 hypothetical protein K8O93_17860 [Gordonia bronchialis]STQ62232.1 Uncharacterised protein [Gordonia bronchialis]